MLKVKRWVPVTYTTREGDEITFEVKRMKFEDATPLNVGLARAYGILGQLDPETATVQQQVEALAAMRDSLPDGIIQQCFSDYVRNVGGIEDEDGPMTTGAALYEIADEHVVMCVLGELRRHARLSGAEGKDSPSPGGSPSTQEPPASDSPAPSISADSATLSIAPEIPIASESSTASV